MIFVLFYVSNRMCLKVTIDYAHIITNFFSIRELNKNAHVS